MEAFVEGGEGTRRSIMIPARRERNSGKEKARWMHVGTPRHPGCDGDSARDEKVSPTQTTRLHRRCSIARRVYDISRGATTSTLEAEPHHICEEDQKTFESQKKGDGKEWYTPSIPRPDNSLQSRMPAVKARQSYIA